MTQPFCGSAAERNKQPIFEQLTPLLEGAHSVLEIGAGQGAHARHALHCLPTVHWQATEHPTQMETLAQALAGCTELPEPLALDVAGPWPAGPFGAVYAANVAHIMAWPEVCLLFAGSARSLAPDGLLCLYGPFFDDAVPTAPSNDEFDQRLRAIDPTMGLRRVQALDDLAGDYGLRRGQDWEMPANNRLLVWQQSRRQYT